ncbi:MAG: hypothetical protein E7559_03650 [Ruminococcaceae bacterium]|nr:hypothetical protein [Oscillospiraceae bacterium]
MANEQIMNSDFANLVIEGYDVLHGNFFRNEWALSGVSFTATDIPFYAIGAAVAGISSEAYVLAVTLMLVFAAFAGAFLMFDDISFCRSRIVPVCIYLGIVAFPCGFWGNIGRAHIGSFAWAFAGLYFLNRMRKTESAPKKYVIPAIVFLALSAWGDSVALAGIIMPVVLLECYRLFIDFIQKKPIRKTAGLYSAAAAFSGAVLGMVLDKLYFVIGSADKNTFMQSKLFLPVEEYYDRATMLFECIFMVNDAGFMNTPLLSANTALYFVRSLFVVAGLVLIVYYSVRALANRSCDFICSVLSIGYVILSLLFVITNISVDFSSFRYLSHTPVVFAILIVRTYTVLIEKYGERIRKDFVMWAAAALSVVLLTVSALPLPQWYIVKDESLDKAIDVLEAEGLTCGYSDYWNASQMTVMSLGKVKSRAVIWDGEIFRIHYWICRSDWYSEPAHFVLVDEGMTVHGITEDTVVQAYGEPDRIIDVEDIHIYIYDEDISFKENPENIPELE